MSKKDKGEKAQEKKELSFEDQQALLASTKEELSEAKAEKKTYMKENDLKKGEDYSADPKHGKKMGKFQEVIDKKQAKVDELTEWVKENKPKKEAKVRETSYVYPEGMTDAGDKKKHRAKMRAEKKKAEKEAAGGGKTEKPEKEKKSKKVDPADAPAEDTGKKDKKKKKKENADD